MRYNSAISTPILATKLYLPPPRPAVVRRPRLIERLNAGLHRKLTLVAAPAGFGKTTLLSEWLARCGRAVAWLALDEGDNDPLTRSNEKQHLNQTRKCLYTNPGQPLYCLHSSLPTKRVMFKR